MIQNKPKQDWITTDDFETEFQISKQLQAQWRHKNKVPYSKIGNTIRYSRAKIEKLFNDAEVTK